MSYNFILTGNQSVLEAEFNPPIYLEDGEHMLGLVNFEAYNSIPNIYEGRNTFYYGKDAKIVIPDGCYQIRDINDYINAHLPKNIFVSITANNNTLKTQIKSTEDIDFTPIDSIAPLLGFKNKKIPKSAETHVSDSTANITSVNALLIECNLISGSYENGKPVHIVHSFFPKTPPGFKIIESPEHVIYLPINVRVITKLIIKILNQDNKLVNFRGETVTIGLHLKTV